MANDPYKYFRIEARELTDRLGQGVLEIERGDHGSALVSELLRHAHTLKGAARVVRQHAIAERAHAIEEALLPLRRGEPPVPDLTNTVLKCVDAIVADVEALDAPPAPGQNPETKPHEGIAAPLGTAYDGVDGLIDDLDQAFAQIGRLREVVKLAERAGRLAVAAAMEIVPAAASKAPIALQHTRAQEFRQMMRDLMRSVGETQDSVERELRQVREAAVRLRLNAVGSVFPLLDRAVRDVALTLGRQAVFEGQGGEVRLDASVLRVMQEALIQTVRNSVAHGIEPPAERIANTKAAQGRVRVAVTTHGHRVVFRCEDDGRGIDFEALRTAAIRNGLATDGSDELGPTSLATLVLKGGISTASTASQVSGRGIGMDIVRDALARLGGEVSVETERGVGTAFLFSVPISTTMVDVLVVRCGDQKVAIPRAAVRRMLRVARADIQRRPRGDAGIIHDGTAIPLVQLDVILDIAQPGSPPPAALSAVVIRGPQGDVALAVDRTLGVMTVAVQPLPDLMPELGLIAGATLDADGVPILVFDPTALDAAIASAAVTDPAASAPKRRLLVVDDSATTRFLEQSILETGGFIVDTAESAEVALDLLRGDRYALILCDVEMPGMDGFAFTERLRQDPAHRDVPIFLVTSRSAPEDIQRGKDVGAQEYVVKSAFDQTWLIARIRDYVG